MSTFYDGRLGTAGTKDNTLIGDAGESGSIKYHRFTFNTATATIDDGDVVRLASFKSNDRIKSLTFEITSTMGSGAVCDIGFYQSVPDNEGAVVEIDTFADAWDIAAATGSVDIFTAASDTSGGGTVVLVDEDRGLELWELVGQSADPSETWDLTVTLTDAGSGNFTGTCQIEVVNAE